MALGQKYRTVRRLLVHLAVICAILIVEFSMERQCLFALTLFLTDEQDSIYISKYGIKFFEAPNAIIAGLAISFEGYLPNSSQMYVCVNVQECGMSFVEWVQAPGGFHE